MPAIKFSHNYPKLHDQTSARLIGITLHSREEFTANFIEYDTVYEGGHYPLPMGTYMVLLFVGNELIPFTTVRPWTEEKEKYYRGLIDSILEIKIMTI